MKQYREWSLASLFVCLFFLCGCDSTSMKDVAVSSPEILSFSPESGSIGSEIVVTGEYLDDVVSATIGGGKAVILQKVSNRRLSLKVTVCALIHPKEEDEEPRLRFITGGMLSTAELSILQARKEIHLFAERTHRMFGMVQDLLHTEKDDDFNKLFSRIEKYENISDNMELEIANYLNQVSEGRLSSESKLQIRAMLREVTEIESIGDSCYNLARTINRKRQTNQDFTEKQYEHIHFMMKLTNDALAQMIVVVEKPEHQNIDINKSFNIENEINNYRNQLKNQNILDVNNKEYDYQMGVYYMDIIAECEKLGDYVVNVVEASSDVKEKKAS